MAGSGGSITEWISFSDRGFPPGLWHVFIPEGDLEHPASSLRLYLNRDVESFRRLLSTTSSSQRDRLLAHNFVRRLIRAAFIQGVVSLALACPEDDLPDDAENTPGTCWEVAFNLCRKTFPRDWDPEDQIGSIREIQQKYGVRPNLVETCVQTFAQLPDILERSQILNPPGVA